jgi:hypothetical protein
VVVFYQGSNETYGNSALVYTITTGSNIITSSSQGQDFYFGAESNIDSTQITGIGLLIRGENGWNDYDAAGTYSIDYISIGDAIVPDTNLHYTGLIYSGSTSGKVGDTITLSANATSGASPVFSILSGSSLASLSGNLLLLNQPGTVTLGISVSSLPGFASQNIQQKIVILPTIETTTITYSGPRSGLIGDTILLSASVSSGADPVFSITSGSSFALLSGNKLALNQTGIVSIEISVSSIAGYSSASFIQDIAIFQTLTTTISINAPTSDGKGYLFNFNGTEASNCLDSNSSQYSNYGFAPMTVSSGSLIVDVPIQTSYNSNVNILNFYTGNCNWSTINLSDLINQKFTISLNSSPASTTTNRQLIVVLFQGTNSTYSNSALVYTITAGSNIITSSSQGQDLYFGAASNIDSTQISGIGLLIRGENGFGDYDAAGTYSIDYISIGDASVPGSNFQTIAVPDTGQNTGSVGEILSFPSTDSAGVPQSYAIISGGSLASISGNQLTLNQPGTVTIAITIQQEIVIYPTSTTLGNGRSAQPTTVSYKGQTSGAIGSTITLSAASGAGSAPIFTILSGADLATISGDQLTLNQPGTVTLGITIWQDIVISQTDRVTNIETSKTTGLVTLSPNPAAETLQLKTLEEQAGILSFALIDLSGHTINSFEWNIPSGVNIQNINTSQLSSGIYLAKISFQSGSDSFQKIQRISIQH